ncbi:hypothetical protein BKA59DRAFT_484689 [Fusarium tricinctum]|uniref:Transmembrane protein n=1 Tax=Fusarium tricinctum TaxID=61284 RepID=A0A8K0W6G2_9HYPO|nr:hypothetical protein BKA59DRAFT_484689 [Fusarium tricinctum]
MAPLNPFDAIGWDVACRDNINKFLDTWSEYDKWGSSAATTITALIPLLISVWGLPTADILELYLVDEHLVAAFTAGLTFALPVRQEPSFKKLTETLLRSHSRRSLVPEPTCHNRLKFFLYRLAFVLSQMAIILLAIGFNHFLIDSPPQPFWSCPTGPAVWHICFLLAIPSVGFIWWSVLVITYRKMPLEGGSGIVLYNRRFAFHPLIQLLPGLLQALLTILYTFMFAVLYGTSIRSALERVIIMAFAVFLSRALSLWYASVFKDRHPKLLIHCEDGDNLNDRRRIVEAYIGIPSPPLTSPSVSVASQRDSEPDQVQVQRYGRGLDEQWLPLTDLSERQPRRYRNLTF